MATFSLQEPSNTLALEENVYMEDLTETAEKLQFTTDPEFVVYNVVDTRNHLLPAADVNILGCHPSVCTGKSFVNNREIVMWISAAAKESKKLVKLDPLGETKELTFQVRTI